MATFAWSIVEVRRPTCRSSFLYGQYRIQDLAERLAYTGLCVMAGVDAVTVEELTGHKHITMTLQIPVWLLFINVQPEWCWSNIKKIYNRGGLKRSIPQAIAQ